MFLPSEVAEQIIARELSWAMPVLKSVTLDTSTMAGVHDSQLTIDYEGKCVRYQVIRANYNEDRTEVTLYLQLDRILNDGDPE